MSLVVKVSNAHVLCVVFYIITSQFEFIKAAKCMFKDSICDCSNTDIHDLELDCDGATTLVLNNHQLSEDNWPNEFNLVNTDITNVTFSGNGLQMIPIEYLPANLEVLVLSDNRIEYIPGNQLSRLKKLNVLDISNNIISDVHDDAFVGLCTLEELNLTGNNLNNFKNISAALKKAPSLKILDLSENLFQKVFVPGFLKNLQVLNLRHNIISVVSISSCTYRLPNLKVINLENNNLTWFPKSIIDSLQDTNILLSKNPLRCACEVLRPLVKFNNTGLTCVENGLEYNMNAILVSGCQIVGMETRDTMYSDSLTITSGSHVSQRICSDKLYCSKFADSTTKNECDETTEICWDLPEDVCEEIRDLAIVTESGSLDMTMARYFDLTGSYTYMEYHTCDEKHLYTVTGQVIYSTKTYNTQQRWHRDDCPVDSTPCSLGDDPSRLAGWKIALITIACLSLVSTIVMMIVCRKISKHRTFERDQDRTTVRYASSKHAIDSGGSRSKFGVPHVVRDGLLIRPLQFGGHTPDYLHNYDDVGLHTAEAEAQGYRPLSFDTSGYLSMKPNLKNSFSADSVGYYVLLPNESKREILVDADGYLSVNQPEIHNTDDGYICMTLRKDQGTLGQLVTDPSMYIKLEFKSTDDDHIYTKLSTVWKLLKFWQNKEEENSVTK